MTKQNWQEKRKKKKELKYIGYTTGYHTFTWEYVNRISHIYISLVNVNKPLAKYFIYFTDGSHIKIDVNLPLITKTTKGIFWGTNETPVRTNKTYFDNNCDELVAIRASRNKAAKSFLNFKKHTLKKI